jgi:hypothetical protein
MGAEREAADSSSVGLSRPPTVPSVDIRCIEGVSVLIDATVELRLDRAADFGGTTGLGFDGPATGTPANFSFIALTEIG